LKVKNLILLFVFAVGVIGFTACSDIKYAPPPAVSVTQPSVDSPNVQVVENKYKLKKFDLTPKSFNYTHDFPEPGELSKTFTVEVDFNSPQHYRIGMVATALTGNPVVMLSAGDEVFGAFYFDEEAQEEQYFISPVYFPKNKVELTFTVLRGRVKVTQVSVENTSAISSERFVASKTLCSPAPSAETIGVFEYLTHEFGQRVLTSQHCTVNTNAEIEAVYKSVGRYPAVRFVELAGVLPADVLDGEVELMKQWWSKGGIVGVSWLPDAPKDGNQDAFFDDIDVMAQVLLKLASENVPVLFNPLPDAGSRLNWWGDSAKEFVQLWQFVYEQMTGVHGLDNIIWVWSGGNHRYYPGDNRVDIIGESAVVEGNVGTQAVKLAYTDGYSSGNSFNKPAIIGVSSGVPSPDALARDNAAWLIWSLYKGEFVIDKSGEIAEGIENSLDRFYNHELTVCLDNLPKFILY